MYKAPPTAPFNGGKASAAALVNFSNAKAASPLSFMKRNFLDILDIGWSGKDGEYTAGNML
jgi:hypothetical protein